MTPPEREARKPTLTSTRVMRRPLLWRCSMTNMSSPTAPWTKSEEKRHHRNTQYHISDREGDKKTQHRQEG